MRNPFRLFRHQSGRIHMIIRACFSSLSRRSTEVYAAALTITFGWTSRLPADMIGV